MSAEDYGRQLLDEVKEESLADVGRSSHFLNLHVLDDSLIVR